MHPTAPARARLMSTELCAAACCLHLHCALGTLRDVSSTWKKVSVSSVVQRSFTARLAYVWLFSFRLASIGSAASVVGSCVT